VTTEPAAAEVAPGPPPRSRRVRRLIGAGALILLLWSWFDLTGQPQYSLYRLSSAIEAHDVAGAERYFDVEQISDAAARLVVADYLARQSGPTGPAQATGGQLGRSGAVEGMRPLVAVRVRAEIRRMVETAGPQQASIAVPAGFLGAFRAFQVSREGGEAWVSYADARKGVMRFRMTRQADRSWKITEFDRDWVRRQLRGRHQP
jgi:hypothetical protein